MGVFGMKNWIKPAGLYALVCAAALLSAMALSRVGSAVAVFSRETGTTVVVDAGHGGEDGGTLSCTGVRESGLNLEIALRVNDLFALLGQRTRMLRTQDVSLHDTDAATIAARKASDIRGARPPDGGNAEGRAPEHSSESFSGVKIPRRAGVLCRR